MCAIACLFNAGYSETTCIRHDSHVSPDLHQQCSVWSIHFTVWSITLWMRVCVYTLTYKIFYIQIRVVCACFFFFFFDKDKWLFSHPIMLYTRCCLVCMGLSMWLRPWNCNKARASHREDRLLCSAQKYEILPFVSLCVCLRTNNIGTTPTSEVNVRAR